jgi:3-dehydroquinate synthase II
LDKEKEKNKELFIAPLMTVPNLELFLNNLDENDTLFIDPTKLKKRKNFKIIYESELADIIICKSMEDLIKNKTKDKALAYYKKVFSNKDIDDIESAITNGANYIIVDADDWKIIPLENIIANLQNTRTKIFTTAKNSDEVRTMFAVLELGVDGVILSTGNVKDIEKSKQYLKPKKFEIKVCEIVDFRDVGIGERVCVDTVSMLETGEGMLVGSASNFLFLLHNESGGSSFTSPRPVRVNAGAVYCYTLLSSGKTIYLSEVESGTEIFIVNKEGNSRVVSVGRSKIETRPMRLIKAIGDNIQGTVIVQNAETIQLIRENGDLLPVTSIKRGDKILAFFKPSRGRHFGIEVDEYIIEK